MAGPSSPDVSHANVPLVIVMAASVIHNIKLQICTKKMQNKNIIKQQIAGTN